MYNRIYHLTDRATETSSAEQLLIEVVTDAHWVKSWFEAYARDLEELARSAEDAEVRVAAGRRAHFANGIHMFVAAALREEASGITVIELTCERVESEVADEAPCSDPDEEHQQ